MTPEYHSLIGGRNGTANAATSACPATRRQNRNRRNQSTVAYRGASPARSRVTKRSPHDHRSLPTRQEKSRIKCKPGPLSARTPFHGPRFLNSITDQHAEREHN